MKDGNRKLDVAKVTGTLEHGFSAGTAHDRAVDGSQLWVVESLFAWFVPLLIHRLWIFDVADTHVLDFFRREETELDLLNRLQRSAGIREGMHRRHVEDG